MNYIDEYRKIFDGGKFLRKGKEITLKEYAAFDGGGVRTLIDHIVDELKLRKSVTILDWGCGTSVHWHTQCLKKNTKSMMNVLGEKVRGFYRYDPAFSTYNIKPNDKFDFVICSDVLEHIPDEALDNFFKEINSYVHHDGVVFYSISTTPSNNSFVDGTNMHINVKAPNSWYDILRKNSIVKTRVVFNGKHNY